MSNTKGVIFPDYHLNSYIIDTSKKVSKNKLPIGFRPLYNSDLQNVIDKQSSIPSNDQIRQAFNSGVIPLDNKRIDPRIGIYESQLSQLKAEEKYEKEINKRQPKSGFQSEDFEDDDINDSINQLKNILSNSTLSSKKQNELLKSGIKKILKNKIGKIPNNLINNLKDDEGNELNLADIMRLLNSANSNTVFTPIQQNTNTSSVNLNSNIPQAPAFNSNIPVPPPMNINIPIPPPFTKPIGNERTIPRTISKEEMKEKREKQKEQEQKNDVMRQLQESILKPKLRKSQERKLQEKPDNRTERDKLLEEIQASTQKKNEDKMKKAIFNVPIEAKKLGKNLNINNNSTATKILYSNLKQIDKNTTYRQIQKIPMKQKLDMINRLSQIDISNI